MVLQHWSPFSHTTFRKWDHLIILLYKTPMMLPHDHLTFFIIMHLSFHSFWCTCIFSYDQIDVNCITFYFYFIRMEQHWVQYWIVTKLSENICWQCLLTTIACEKQTLLKCLMMNLKKQGQRLGRGQVEKGERKSYIMA